MRVFQCSRVSCLHSNIMNAMRWDPERALDISKSVLNTEDDAWVTKEIRDHARMYQCYHVLGRQMEWLKKAFKLVDASYNNGKCSEESDRLSKRAQMSKEERRMYDKMHDYYMSGNM